MLICSLSHRISQCYLCDFNRLLGKLGKSLELSTIVSARLSFPGTEMSCVGENCLLELLLTCISVETRLVWFELSWEQHQCPNFSSTCGANRAQSDSNNTSRTFSFPNIFCAAPHFNLFGRLNKRKTLKLDFVKFETRFWIFDFALKYEWHVKVLVSICLKSSTESTVCYVEGRNSYLIWYFPRWVYFLTDTLRHFFVRLWYHILHCSKAFPTLIYAADSFLLSSALPLLGDGLISECCLVFFIFV